MKNLLIFLCLGLSFMNSACNAERRAHRAINKQPEQFAGDCARLFPAKDSLVYKNVYVPGKDIVHTDTIQGPGNIVYIDRWHQRTDTLRDSVVGYVENTAQVTALRQQLQGAQAATVRAEAQRDQWKAEARKHLVSMGWLTGIIILLVFIICLMIYRRMRKRLPF